MPLVVAALNMSKLTRSAVFRILGVKPTNPRWSWCAGSPDESIAVFTIWSDRIANGRTRLLPETGTRRNGAIDQKRLVGKAIAKKMRVYGLVCVAMDPTASPRKIKEVNSDYLIRLNLVREGEQVVGVHLARVPLGVFLNQTTKKGGLADLDAPPPGSDTADRALKSGFVVIRDEKVRRAVLVRASGRCEHCGKEGFLMPNGKRYVEAHHIIALGNQGRDRVDNVIALCADHHREAHFGTTAEALEAQFIKKIGALQKTGKAPNSP